MISMNGLHKSYSSEIDKLSNATKYKLIKSNITNNITLKDKGIYALYDKDKLIYIGQAGGNIKIDHNSKHLLRERLLQYTRCKDTGTKNFKKYLEEKTVTIDDIKFSFITINDCRLIKIIELVMIDYFNVGKEKSTILINK